MRGQQCLPHAHARIRVKGAVVLIYQSVCQSVNKSIAQTGNLDVFTTQSCPFITCMHVDYYIHFGTLFVASVRGKCFTGHL